MESIGVDLMNNQIEITVQKSAYGKRLEELERTNPAIHKLAIAGAMRIHSAKVQRNKEAQAEAEDLERWRDELLEMVRQELPEPIREYTDYQERDTVLWRGSQETKVVTVIPGLAPIISSWSYSVPSESVRLQVTGGIPGVAFYPVLWEPYYDRDYMDSYEVVSNYHHSRAYATIEEAIDIAASMGDTYQGALEACSELNLQLLNENLEEDLSRAAEPELSTEDQLTDTIKALIIETVDGYCGGING